MLEEKNTRRGRPSSRDKILEAAHDIVVEYGAGRLTYEALAERTGISKGGLLHHFPSKISLLEAMISNHVDKRRKIRTSKLHGMIGRPEADIISLIETRLEESMQPHPNAASVLAAATEKPELLRPIKQALREEAEEIWTKSESPALSYLTVLALEGLCFQEIFGVSPLNSDQKKMVIAAIRSII